MVRSSTSVARGAVRLEKRDLRFDDGEVGVGLHADLAEGRDAVRADRQIPCLQKFGMRVDAQTQRPAARHRVGQPGAEPGIANRRRC